MSADGLLAMHFRPQKKNAKTESLCVLINLLDGYQTMPIREPQARAEHPAACINGQLSLCALPQAFGAAHLLTSRLLHRQWMTVLFLRGLRLHWVLPMPAS